MAASSPISSQFSDDNENDYNNQKELKFEGNNGVKFNGVSIEFSVDDYEMFIKS